MSNGPIGNRDINYFDHHDNARIYYVKLSKSDVFDPRIRCVAGKPENRGQKGGYRMAAKPFIARLRDIILRYTTVRSSGITNR